MSICTPNLPAELEKKWLYINSNYKTENLALLQVLPYFFVDLDSRLHA